MRQEKFSIIIPHYGIPHLLVRCLQSIPAKDDIQVIVVDDNSSDADTYLERIPELKRSNVEWVRTHEGRGAGYVRNVGLSHARGEWLIFADADDFFTEDFYGLIDTYRDAKEDVLYFNTLSCLCEDVNTPANRTKDFMFERYEREHNEELFRFGYTEPWGKMIRRSMVVEHNIRFDETKVSNDYLFSVMTGYYAKTVGIINQPLYVYTVRQNSLASDDGHVNLEKIQARLDAYIRVQQFMESKGYSSMPALTSHILVPLFKNYREVYLSYRNKLREKNLSVKALYRDTVLHYLYRLVGKRLPIGDVYTIKWRKG